MIWAALDIIRLSIGCCSCSCWACVCSAVVTMGPGRDGPCALKLNLAIWFTGPPPIGWRPYCHCSSRRLFSTTPVCYHPMSCSSIVFCHCFSLSPAPLLPCSWPVPTGTPTVDVCYPYTSQSVGRSVVLYTGYRVIERSIVVVCTSISRYCLLSERRQCAVLRACRPSIAGHNYCTNTRVQCD